MFIQKVHVVSSTCHTYYFEQEGLNAINELINKIVKSKYHQISFMHEKVSAHSCARNSDKGYISCELGFVCVRMDNTLYRFNKFNYPNVVMGVGWNEKSAKETLNNVKLIAKTFNRFCEVMENSMAIQIEKFTDGHFQYITDNEINLWYDDLEKHQKQVMSDIESDLNI
jgi:hypothetical protein